MKQHLVLITLATVSITGSLSAMETGKSYNASELKKKFGSKKKKKDSRNGNGTKKIEKPVQRATAAQMAPQVQTTGIRAAEEQTAAQAADCPTSRVEVLRAVSQEIAEINQRNVTRSFWDIATEPVLGLLERKNIQTLIELGLDLRQIDEEDRTILMRLVCEAADVKGFLEIKGTRKHINQQNEGGQTALMFAAILGYEEQMDALLEAGADPSFQDKRGYTAVSIAKACGFFRLSGVLWLAQVLQDEKSAKNSHKKGTSQ